jgi:hypothetical protein
MKNDAFLKKILGDSLSCQKENIMELKNLKNFGKSLSDITTSMHREQRKEISAISYQIIRNHLGLFNLIRFTISTKTETRRMSRIDLTNIRQKGLVNEIFIKSQIRFAAMYSAMSKTVGKQRALEILNKIMDEVTPITFQSISPTPEDFKISGDPWEAWKKYFLAMAEADKNAGCHEYELVENTDNTFQMNCIYCAWYEIPKLLGVKEACLPSCYADDVYLPDALRMIGIEFKRTSTMARGENYCDFRFERIND